MQTSAILERDFCQSWTFTWDDKRVLKQFDDQWSRDIAVFNCAKFSFSDQQTHHPSW